MTHRQALAAVASVMFTHIVTVPGILLSSPTDCCVNMVRCIVARCHIPHFIFFMKRGFMCTDMFLHKAVGTEVMLIHI